MFPTEERTGEGSIQNTHTQNTHTQIRITQAREHTSTLFSAKGINTRWINSHFSTNGYNEELRRNVSSLTFERLLNRPSSWKTPVDILFHWWHNKLGKTKQTKEVRESVFGLDSVYGTWWSVATICQPATMLHSFGSPDPEEKTKAP